MKIKRPVWQEGAIYATKDQFIHWFDENVEPFNSHTLSLLKEIEQLKVKLSKAKSTLHEINIHCEGRCSELAKEVLDNLDD